MPGRKYTDAELIEAIENSKTWEDVHAKLGLKIYGNEIAKSVKNCIENLNLSVDHITVIPNTMSHPHSSETKQKLSQIRKEWIKNNKDKHKWSIYGKTENKPERLFREALLELNLSAVQYYIPPESDRGFEIDFALPDAKMAFEINGNQHYENGKLGSYYQERHDYFVAKGWKVNEIHYSECFNKQKILNIIKDAVAGINVSYSSSPEVINYRQKKKEEKLAKQNENKHIKECVEILMEDIKKINNLNYALDILLDYSINGKSKRKLPPEYKPFAGKCGGWNKGMEFPEKRKSERPSKEELRKLIWEKPTIQIAKDFGVSDKAIEKWCNSYGIEKPPRGYWAKLQIDVVAGKKNCIECNKEFEYMVGKEKSAKYCSSRCANKANWQRRKDKKENINP